MKITSLKLVSTIEDVETEFNLDATKCLALLSHQSSNHTNNNVPISVTFLDADPAILELLAMSTSTTDINVKVVYDFPEIKVPPLEVNYKAAIGKNRTISYDDKSYTGFTITRIVETGHGFAGGSNNISFPIDFVLTGTNREDELVRLKAIN